ncbi:10573_t:CDS:1 [Acaulospora morrowiae]|uniref:10573_t:CDS:1 n=1 Tax=Acaulospora morrowiae TaxID=94023 RepID=A0A9N9H370_9GLOM|nr:10573_t:CDS:1 [Acaulospora morrowiae]
MMRGEKRKVTSDPNFNSDSESEVKKLKVTSDPNFNSDSESEVKKLKVTSDSNSDSESEVKELEIGKIQDDEEESKPSGSKQPHSELPRKRRDIKNPNKLDEKIINRILLTGDDSIEEILKCQKFYELANLVDTIAYEIIKTENEDWMEKMNVLQLFSAVKREIYQMIEKKIQSEKTDEVCVWLVKVYQGPAKGIVYENFKIQKWLSENSDGNTN